MDMLEMLVREQQLIEKEFFEYLEEQMVIEADFIMSCLENNIILEADVGENNNLTWWQKFIDLIKRIFNKFISRVKELTTDANMKWFNENEKKFMTINYSGMKSNLQPYWMIKTEDIMQTCNKLQEMMDITKKPSDQELEKLTTTEEVEKYKAFGEITKNGMSFADSIKMVFSGSAEADENNRAIEISDSSSPRLQEVVIKHAIPYVKAYSANTVNMMRQQINKYENNMNAIGNELKKRGVKESFCVLENAYFCDTDLAFCLNATAIFEAEGEVASNAATPANKSDEKKPTEGQVVSSENKDNNASGESQVSGFETKYLRYLKNAIKLNQIALTAAMSALENRFTVYMRLLRSVASAGGNSTESEENKTEKPENK